MMTLPEALKLLKDQRVIASVEGLDEALDTIFFEFDRMHEVLMFYADPTNYDVDGVAVEVEDEEPDMGNRARIALRRKDWGGKVLLPHEITKVRAHIAKKAEAEGDV